VLLDVLNQLNSTNFATTIQAGFKAAGDTVKSLATALRTFIIPALLAIKAGADQVAAAINKVFGTQLTGGAVLFGLAIAKVTGLLSVFTTGLGFAYQAFKLLISGLPVAIELFKLLSLVLRANPIIALAVAIGVLVGLILRQFPQIGVAVKQFFLDPIAGITAAWNAVATFFGTFIENLRNIFASVGLFIADAFNKGVEAVKAFFQPAIDAINAGIEGIKAAWNALGTFFTDLWAGIQTTFDTAWQAIKDGAQAAWDFISSSVSAPFEKIKSVVADMWKFVTDKFNALIDKVKDFLGLQAQADGGDGGGNTPAFAGGGRVRGPGTSTSDSIWAKLSNGEFVVKARAVAHYGPSLLSAINNMRIPRFAAGGFVSGESFRAAFAPAVPRFAAGGLVAAPALAGDGGGGRPVILNIGGESIGGLSATGAAVEALQRYASQKAVRTAGRKPEWYKG
jgi:hypothetical protein